MQVIDADGVWEIQDNVRMLIEPSLDWIARNPIPEPATPPKTELELLQEAQDATSSAVDFLIMNSI
jgi:hypothetical protein